MRIARVFPRRTSYTPTDELAFVGPPPLFRPQADEVHVSCVFTWDRPEAERLAAAWRHYYPVVKLGGPAYDNPGGEFTPGLYTKQGFTTTSRGCPNNCSFCLVPKREGKLRELEVRPGYAIQDNNILAASRRHFSAVCEMLRSQRRAARFIGGLEAARLTDWHAEQLRGLRIRELWFACDSDAATKPLRRAIDKLRWLPRSKLRCYVLCGYRGQSIEQARQRLQAVWDIGCEPFAMLYRPEGKKAEYPPEWKRLARQCSRPALTKLVLSQHWNVKPRSDGRGALLWRGEQKDVGG